MIRLVIANQRGGVSKTTTTATLARYFGDLGMRVLIVDADPQASVGIVLGLQPKRHLYEFVVHNRPFEECIERAGPNIDVLCSNRDTTRVEAALVTMTGGELAFIRLFGQVEFLYDAVLDRCRSFHQPAANLRDAVYEKPPDSGRSGYAQSARRGSVPGDDANAHGYFPNRGAGGSHVASHDRPSIQPDEFHTDGASRDVGKIRRAAAARDSNGRYGTESRARADVPGRLRLALQGHAGLHRSGRSIESIAGCPPKRRQPKRRPRPGPSGRDGLKNRSSPFTSTSSWRARG